MDGPFETDRAQLGNFRVHSACVEISVRPAPALPGASSLARVERPAGLGPLCPDSIGLFEQNSSTHSSGSRHWQSAATAPRVFEPGQSGAGRAPVQIACGLFGVPSPAGPAGRVGPCWLPGCPGPRGPRPAVPCPAARGAAGGRATGGGGGCGPERGGQATGSSPPPALGGCWLHPPGLPPPGEPGNAGRRRPPR